VIEVRRGSERQHVRRRKHEGWLTFDAPVDGAAPVGFGRLSELSESRLPPGARAILAPGADSEMFTYVVDGALAFSDSTGRAGVLRAGEVQRATTGPGIRHHQVNASHEHPVHFLQLRLRPTELQVDPTIEHKRCFAADRRGRLFLVASPGGQRGSLSMQQDACIYSALLAEGEHVVHELVERRIAWLHVVRGEALLGDHRLSAGDGVGFVGERVVSITARGDAELLLVDLLDIE